MWKTSHKIQAIRSRPDQSQASGDRVRLINKVTNTFGGKSPKTSGQRMAAFTQQLEAARGPCTKGENCAEA
jgi:hypothetical protein